MGIQKPFPHRLDSRLRGNDDNSPPSRFLKLCGELIDFNLHLMHVWRRYAVGQQYLKYLAYSPLFAHECLPRRRVQRIQVAGRCLRRPQFQHRDSADQRVYPVIVVFDLVLG